MKRELTWTMGMVVSVALIVVCAAGCPRGYQAGPPSAQAPAGPVSAANTPSSADQAGPITVTATEWRFEPTEITVKEGQPVTIELKNDGAVSHDWATDEFSARTEAIPSGSTATVTFTPNRTGQFTFYCSVPGHREKGMEGTLNVQ